MNNQSPVPLAHSSITNAQPDYLTQARLAAEHGRPQAGAWTASMPRATAESHSNRIPVPSGQPTRRTPLIGGTRLMAKASKLLSRQGLYPFLRDEFGKIPSGAKVLTVGGDGPITDMLRARALDKKFQVTTIDIEAQRQPDIVADYCHESELSAASYDVIVLSEVLEHLHAPEQAIAQTQRLLRPGGLFILTTPFIYPLHDQPHDYFRYTKYGLQHLLRTFEKVTIRGRNGWAEAILVLAARMCMEKRTGTQLFGAVLVAVALLLWPLAHLLSLLIPVDYITTGYLATARARGQPDLKS